MATYETHLDNQQQQQEDNWAAMPQDTLIDCGSENQLEFVDDKMSASADANSSGAAAPSAAVSDLAKQAWKWACWSGEKTWDGLDFAGEVVANFLGLTRSKYQWMIDIQEREEEERRLHKLEARQRRQLRLELLLEQEKRKLAALEAGGDSQHDNQYDDFNDYDDYDFDTNDEDNNRDEALMMMDIP